MAYAMSLFYLVIDRKSRKKQTRKELQKNRERFVEMFPNFPSPYWKVRQMIKRLK